MILTGPQITQEVKTGGVTISHFDPAFVEPNSYGFHLGNMLCVYAHSEIDAFGVKPVNNISIPLSGYVLMPDIFYLGSTLECMGSEIYASELYARRSISTCGIFIQTSAPLGHTGAIINWTLEIVVSHPVRVYPGMLIGKICFWKNRGEIMPYDGRYLASTKAVPSLLSEAMK